MSWEKAIAFVLSYEGGYVNDPNDSGGETNFGISKKAYPSVDIKALTVDEAKDIYKRDYWNAISGDELPGNMAFAAFDCAVNQGVGPAIKLLQIAVGVEVDGKIGPKTVGAAHRIGDHGVWLFLLERAKRYMQTAGVQTWGSNWGERLVRLGKAIFQEPDKAAWPDR